MCLVLFGQPCPFCPAVLLRSCRAQESEGEDAEASRVTLPAAAPGRAGKALAGRQSRVRLHEVGPRLELEIVKVGVLCAVCCLLLAVPVQQMCCLLFVGPPFNKTLLYPSDA